jgi:hypothetical protein
VEVKVVMKKEGEILLRRIARVDKASGEVRELVKGFYR